MKYGIQKTSLFALWPMLVMHTSLTSVDVEWLFSLYKHILSDRKINMSPKHPGNYIIVKYNIFLKINIINRIY
jgi:hypothetical protein